MYLMQNFWFLAFKSIFNLIITEADFLLFCGIQVSLELATSNCLGGWESVCGCREEIGGSTLIHVILSKINLNDELNR